MSDDEESTWAELVTELVESAELELVGFELDEPLWPMDPDPEETAALVWPRGRASSARASPLPLNDSCLTLPWAARASPSPRALGFSTGRIMYHLLLIEAAVRPP